MLSRDLNALEAMRLQAGDAARAILGGERRIREDSRALARLARDLVPDWRVDPDFVVFGAVDSDPDREKARLARERRAGQPRVPAAGACARLEREIVIQANGRLVKVRR